MELSLNEVEATIIKAVRGRGLDHGVALEVGAAARWLCERGLDGIDAVADALADEASECSAASLGLGAVDQCLGSSGTVTVETCLSPLLLRGFSGRVGVEVEEQSGGFVLSPTADEIDHASVVTTVSAPDCWHKIEEWAALTYVPSSDQSRDAGAGAGLTDND